MFGLPPLPRTLAAAIRDSEAPKENVRLSALKDLIRLGRTDDYRADVIASLERRLQEDPAARVRAEAALALADLEAREATFALVRAVEDASPRVQQFALLALGEVGAPHAELRRVLDTASGSQAPELRFQALIGLYKVFEEQALDAVVAGTRDEDAQVRYIALRLLEEHWVERPPSPPSAGAALASPGPTGASFADRLGPEVEIPMAVTIRLRALLRDDAERVRLAAAIFLARTGDRSGVEEIVTAVNARSGAYELEDELSAVEFAGELHLDGARRGLERRAYGLFGASLDATAFQARVSLARLGDRRAVDVILRGLSAWSRDKRTLAVAAAGRAGLLAARETILAMRGDESRADPHAVEEALARIELPEVEPNVGSVRSR